ncbi:MAG: hypothetical protein SGI73_17405 [Chloroflexota bacterium]|nr:hypothetical protein [Chloroflexota bacterium]
MPYTLEWLVERCLLLHRVYGDVTLDELHSMSNESRQLLESSTTTVHSLVDLTGIRSHPTQIKELTAAVNMNAPANLEWTLIVTESRLLRFLGALLTQLARQRVATFPTIASAIQFIAARDATTDFDALLRRYDP